MFITKKRYEEELEKARQKGFEEAEKRYWEGERFREIHQRIDRLAELVEKPRTIGFTEGSATK